MKRPIWKGTGVVLLIIAMIAIAGIIVKETIGCGEQEMKQELVVNEKGVVTRITGTNVHLRKRPYLKAEILKSIGPDDNPITVMEQSLKREKVDDSPKKYKTDYGFYWFLIETVHGDKGWVYGKYIEGIKYGPNRFKEIDIYMPDEEYEHYIARFKKHLVNTVFMCLIRDDKYEGMRFVVDDNYNVRLYTKNKKIVGHYYRIVGHEKDEKGMLVTKVERIEENKLEDLDGDYIEGKLKLLTTKNRLPEVVITLDNGEKIELGVWYSQTYDRMTVDRFVPTSEAYGFFHDMASQ